MKLTILRHSCFSHPREITNKLLRAQVKQQFSVAVRRLDNFTLCGLAAVAGLKLDKISGSQLSLISCAEYFSVELVQQMIIDIETGRAIRPLDFVATVGNAANFYIAKEFNISGSNLFLGADLQALQKVSLISAMDLDSDSTNMSVMLLWHETPQQRQCYAFLVRATTDNDSTLPQLNQVTSISELIDKTTPVVASFAPW